MGAGMSGRVEQTGSKSAALEFAEQQTRRASNRGHEVAGVTLAYSEFTLFPDKFTSQETPGKLGEKVEMEIEKSTKNSRLIKVTGW